jgi:hypothetical protein
MRFNQAVGIDAIGVAKVTAGWIVIRRRYDTDSHDVLAGAFLLPAQAIQAAKDIVSRELDDAGSKLSDDQT